MNKVTKSLAAATVGAMVVSLGLFGAAEASTSEEASYTHPDWRRLERRLRSRCYGQCGGISRSIGWR